jgi:two-component system sensor histidine kinase BaeS
MAACRFAAAARGTIVRAMRFRLWHRLFLAFAALAVLALAGFAAWQQQTFRRGFLAYLDEVALDRLRPAGERLAAAYREHGNWDFLRDDPRRFGELVDPRGEMHRPPPPDLRLRPPSREAAPPEPPRPPGPPGPPPDLGRPHLALLDAAGVYVAGNRELPGDALALPIDLDGVPIGSLRLPRLPHISASIDIGFAREQARSALVAALAVLVGALLLAFAMARWLLAPVRALAAGTHALAAGDYARRIEASRSDEFGALATDFNHLAASLEDHREARRRWGADIAHELRTPLSILRGEIQALQDGVRAPSAQAFDSLYTECERLGSLIEDLYQLSLADAGALDYRFEALDFGECVREAVELHGRLCADAGLVIEVSAAELPPVRGDYRRLAQLVDNLLANACRYTDAPGRIRVELSADAGRVRMTIDDTPPGVPAEHLPHLFERLYRVERSRTRAAGGAGLGLAICRAIVAAHDGRIDAAPSPLGGLRVTVELPVAAARERA